MTPRGLKQLKRTKQKGTGSPQLRPSPQLLGQGSKHHQAPPPLDIHPNGPPPMESINWNLDIGVAGLGSGGGFDDMDMDFATLFYAVNEQNFMLSDPSFSASHPSHTVISSQPMTTTKKELHPGVMSNPNPLNATSM
ncbi:hypothetical protein IV203_019867 [Nitzschia inconspicua]|uniref:Uncharacterized protein n=1 Tax=Nitzschia inconspicua TaxID=303405 RepID=A0A9K3LZW6_9STRA|nr:hypothetical protein IV203_019867 [Nitzschia inconspicua]